MPMQWQTINIPLAGGIDESSDNRWLQPGNFAQVENYTYDKNGSLVKRYGFANLTNAVYKTGTLSSPQNIFATRNGVVAHSNDSGSGCRGSFFTYNPTQNKFYVVSSTTTIDTSSGVAGTGGGVQSAIGTHSFTKVASFNNSTAANSIRAVCGNDSYLAILTASRVYLYDRATKQEIASTGAGIAGQTIKDICMTQNYLWLVTDGTGRVINLYKQLISDFVSNVTFNTASVAHTQTFTAAYVNNLCYVCNGVLNATDNCIMFGSCDNGTNTEYRWGIASTSGTVSSNNFQRASTIVDEARDCSVMFSAQTPAAGDRVFLLSKASLGLFNASSGASVTTTTATSDTNLTQISSVQTTVAIAGGGLNTRVFTNTTDTPDFLRIQMFSKAIPRTGAAGIANVYGLFSGDVSNPASLSTSTPSFHSLWVGQNVNWAQWVGLWKYTLPLRMATFNTSGVISPRMKHIFDIATGKFAWPVVAIDDAPDPTSTTFNSQTVYLIEIDENKLGSSSLYSLNKTLQNRFMELSPPFITRNSSLTATTSGGSLADGTYGATYLYRFKTYSGDILRSAPGAKNSVSLSGGGGSGKITITTPYCKFTDYVSAGASGDNATIDLYATAANGSIYYYCKSIANDDTAVPVATDITTIPSGSATLYSDSELANDPAPHFIATTVCQNRIFGIDATKKRIWWSLEKVDGENYRFSFANTYPYENDEFTAIGTMDEKVILFTKTRTLLFQGTFGARDGSGTNVQLSELASAVGTSQPRSVLTVKDGICFQSVGTIYLLGRDLKINDLGRSLEDTIAANPTCTGSVFFEPDYEARWTVKASDTASTGKMLVFNFQRKTWTTYTILDSVSSVSNAAFNGMCVFDGVHYIMASGGGLHKEDRTTYLDGTTFVSANIITPWIGLGAFGGTPAGDFCARFLVLQYRRNTASDIKIEVQYDYNDAGAWTTLGTWTDGVLSATVDEKIRVHLPRQRMSGCRFRITNQYSSGTLGTGKGYDLTGLSIELSPLTGMGALLPAAKRG